MPPNAPPANPIVHVRNRDDPDVAFALAGSSALSEARATCMLALRAWESRVGGRVCSGGERPGLFAALDAPEQPGGCGFTSTPASASTT